jgi:hypothetical protein
MDDLLFEPDTHEYRHHGLVVPSVTQVLEPLVDFSRVPEHVLDYARERGQAVHLACQLYDEDDLDIASLDPVIVPYLEAWIKFKADTKFEVLGIEQQYVHPVHRYAGTIDRRGIMGITGERAILEIKAVAKLSPVTGLQTAGYKELVERQTAEPGLARYSVRLRDNGLYELKHYDSADDFRVFLSLLNVRNWRSKHAA